MNLQELEQHKKELIDLVESWNFTSKDSQTQQALILKLLKGTSIDDPDFVEVLEDGTGEAIINLFLDCYDLKGFVNWLADHDFDLFIDYRYADKQSIKDYINDIDSYESAPHCYDFDIDEFKKLTDSQKRNYIVDHFDGLLIGSETLVFSW